MGGRSRMAQGAVTLGALAVVGAGLLPWFRVDTGAPASGYRLAELTLALDTDLLPPPWLALVWYLLPALAIGCWTLGHLAARRPVRVARQAAATTLVLLAAAFLVVAVDQATPLQPGPVVALGGAAATLSGVMASRLPAPAGDRLRDLSPATGGER